MLVQAAGNFQYLFLSRIWSSANVLIPRRDCSWRLGQPSFPATCASKASASPRLRRTSQPTRARRCSTSTDLRLAPGFIDMHSHGNGGLFDDLDAATVTRQGVTTILVGQDGESDFPLRDFYAKLQATPAAINVASMVGQATLRGAGHGQGSLPRLDAA